MVMASRRLQSELQTVGQIERTAERNSLLDGVAEYSEHGMRRTSSSACERLYQRLDTAEAMAARTGVRRDFSPRLSTRREAHLGQFLCSRGLTLSHCQTALSFVEDVFGRARGISCQRSAVRDGAFRVGSTRARHTQPLCGKCLSPCWTGGRLRRSKGGANGTGGVLKVAERLGIGNC